MVVVTRGMAEGARKWREQTACQFPIYLDPSRELYAKFNMKRSLDKVLTFKF